MRRHGCGGYAWSRGPIKQDQDIHFGVIGGYCFLLSSRQNLALKDVGKPPIVISRQFKLVHYLRRLNVEIRLNRL